MKDINRFIKEMKENEKEIWLHNLPDNILGIINTIDKIKKEYSNYHIYN